MDSNAPLPQVNADLNRLQEQLHELHQRCAIDVANGRGDGDTSNCDTDMVIRER